ncbi:MAG: hypothetical protein AAB581_02500 [Patescibacteria group bacterium]
MNFKTKVVEIVAAFVVVVMLSIAGYKVFSDYMKTPEQRQAEQQGDVKRLVPERFDR